AMTLHSTAGGRDTRSNAAAPVVERVLEALVERDGGRPAGERPEPARVPDQRGDVDGAYALGDLPHLNRARGEREEALDPLRDRGGGAGGGVVGPAGLAPAQQEPVRADHVAHVGEVPPRRGGADLEDRVRAPSLDLGDLAADVAP